MRPSRMSRWLAALALVFSTAALLGASFDAEAQRLGAGRSFGRQSSNILQQRRAVTPPAASTAQRAAASGAAAGAAAKTGASRWLGPLAGIAAGLGIASLLSHFGLSGAFLELLSSALLIALIVFGVMFLLRRLRGASLAMQGTTQGVRRADRANSASVQPLRREAMQTVQSSVQPVPPAVVASAVAQPVDPSWFIPGDFDVTAFLAQAKKQFVLIQGIWDSGRLDQLSDYLTDDLIAEMKPQLQAREANGKTEVILLNAELLGIEKVANGHLASVRYSGMLREAREPEAFRFEEVWNLYKSDDHGWLLAGIQQIPVEYAS